MEFKIGDKIKNIREIPYERGVLPKGCVGKIIKIEEDRFPNLIVRTYLVDFYMAKIWVDEQDILPVRTQKYKIKSCPICQGKGFVKEIQG